MKIENYITTNYTVPAFYYKNAKFVKYKNNHHMVVHVDKENDTVVKTHIRGRYDSKISPVYKLYIKKSKIYKHLKNLGVDIDKNFDTSLLDYIVSIADYRFYPHDIKYPEILTISTFNSFSENKQSYSQLISKLLNHHPKLSKSKKAIYDDYHFLEYFNYYYDDPPTISVKVFDISKKYIILKSSVQIVAVAIIINPNNILKNKAILEAAKSIKKWRELHRISKRLSRDGSLTYKDLKSLNPIKNIKANEPHNFIEDLVPFMKPPKY